MKTHTPTNTDKPTKKKSARKKTTQKLIVSEVTAYQAQRGSLLALDVSSTTIGMILFQAGTVTWRMTWTLDGATGDARTWQAYQRMRHWLTTSHHIDMVAMENVAYSRFELVSQVSVQSAIKLALWETRGPSLPLLRIAPNTIKKRFTGSGRADKTTMMEHARRLMGVTAIDEHQADAFALGWCVLHWTATEAPR